MMLSFQESNTVITFDDLKEETIGKQRLSLIPKFIQRVLMYSIIVTSNFSVHRATIRENHC